MDLVDFLSEFKYPFRSILLHNTYFKVFKTRIQWNLTFSLNPNFMIFTLPFIFS